MNEWMQKRTNQRHDIHGSETLLVQFVCFETENKKKAVW